MDVREALGAQRVSGELRRHRHDWHLPLSGALSTDQMSLACPCGVTVRGAAEFWHCRCGALRDEAKAARGKSSRRLGSDQERRIERVYGPRKVGEYGDAIDLIGRDFMWQSKATRTPYLTVPGRGHQVWGLPRAYVSFTRPIEAMLALRQDRMPLLIRSWVQQGRPTTDVLIVRARDWQAFYGSTPRTEYIAMTGAHFLDVHGRDEAVTFHDQEETGS